MNNGSEVVEVMQSGVDAAHEKWMKHRAEGTAGTPEGIAAFDEMQLASATVAGERAGRSGALAVCRKCQGVYAGSLGAELCERCFAVQQVLETSADLFNRIRGALARWQSPAERALAQSALVGATAALERAKRAW